MISLFANDNATLNSIKKAEMKRKPIPLAEIEQQIYSKRGTISAVVSHFKVACSTIYRRIEEQPALAEADRYCRGTVISAD